MHVCMYVHESICICVYASAWHVYVYVYVYVYVCHLCLVSAALSASS